MTKSAKAAIPSVQEPEDATILPLFRVAFRHQDAALQTEAVCIGERMTSGWHVGAVIEAIFATPLGIVVELKYADGREVAILHTGDTTGALA